MKEILINNVYKYKQLQYIFFAAVLDYIALSFLVWNSNIVATIIVQQI